MQKVQFLSIQYMKFNACNANNIC